MRPTSLPNSIATTFALALAISLIFTQTSSALQAADAPQAQTEPESTVEDGPTLTIGNPAPRLSEATWLKGTGFETFEPGKVYVLDFWATWCGPCIRAMPHLHDISEKYEEQGLVVAAVTTADENNPAENVKQFVETRGAEFNFAFAMCETDFLDRAYMQAAQRTAIPCSFVVDQQGNIAYIGLPGDVDWVIEKLFDGTWRGQETIDEIAAVTKQIDQLMATAIEEDPASVLAELDQIATKHPHLTNSHQYILVRINSLIQAKRGAELKDYFNLQVQRLTEKRDSMMLANYAGFLINRDLNPDELSREEGLAAIEAALTFAPEDQETMIAAAAAYAMGGEAKKAAELLDKAIAATDNEAMKAQLKQLKAIFGIPSIEQP